MWKKTSKMTDQTAEGQVGFKKRSKVPGVMITQFVEEIPEGKAHPDFTRKPIALTIQEGKLAIFKAIVIGHPEPTVTWVRNNGDVSDQHKYQTKFDPISREHTLEMPNVSPEQADTYKCFATNEFGRASVTVVLNVIEVGYKKDKAKKDAKLEPIELKTALKRKSNVRPKTVPKKEGEIDPKFWEILLSADKKDYEHICSEYGVTDFRWMLKKLNEKKREREEQQTEFVKSISNLKHIEVKPSGTALFEVDLDLVDPSSRIFIYKDGEMIEYSKDMDMKHSLKQVGKKFVFTIRDLLPDDAGLYQLDVENVTMFSTEFKIPKVEFLVKIQEVKAMEREDAMFECVLSNPFSKILWVGKNVPVEQGEKYDITVSEDKLIHRLVVKDCMLVDKGIYAAVAGIKSCNAWLIVEADSDPNLHGKKKVRKTTQAGGSGLDLAKVAAEQQIKLLKEKEEVISDIKTAMPEKDAEVSGDSKTSASISGSGIGSMSEGGSAFGSRSGLGSGASPAIGGTGAPVEETRSGFVKSGENANLTSAARNANSASSEECCENASLTSQPPENAACGKPPTFVTRLNDDRMDRGGSNDAKKPSEVPTCKSSGTPKLTNQSGKNTNSDEQKFATNICNSQATITAGDVPQFDRDELCKFSKPVVVKAGQNATFKMMFPPQDSLEIKWFKEGSELIDGGGVKVVKESNYSCLQIKNCLQSDAGEINIQLKNLYGAVEALSRLIVLGKPSPPKGPAELLECTSSVIELKWNPPSNDGGSPVKNYIIERQQTGQSIWKKLGDVSADQLTFRDRNVCHGKRYSYRIYAENCEGIGDPLETDHIMAGALVFPDCPGPPTIVSAFKNCINLEWAPPEKDRGTKILGYQLEKRKKDTSQWVSLNSINEPIEALKYSVKKVSEGSEYEFRVSAINASGAGEPSQPSQMVCAKNPNMKPHLKDPVHFMVVRAGNTVRIVVNYEASPSPEISWSKNNEPVPPCFKTVNTEGVSVLTIPNSKRSDSGVYTIMAKNSCGKTSFDIDVRVTDEPKKPGQVTLEQREHGKVIITWAPSPEQELDDQLHYIIAKYDTISCIWHTIATRLFCTSYTADIQPGHEYHFRIYAKNDMGMSEPSESPVWGVYSLKNSLSRAPPAVITFERPPSISVPLKVHTPPKGYQCYMTCAVRGCPKPHVSWYLNGICINSNKHYYITNAHGVCSMYILRVELEDAGEYKVVAVNSFGKAECSATLTVKD
ncbi:immunoglobulin-like and fibronectin type III domain-containing protein 1 [Hemibagrus wyckioides]|uniref:immunoglobulin-like and fibronectin type III domain-containing protein 1 n=1 Tax=Hemibagrus wyckioides TaxID=337641 RepID=UPI00266B4F73|nr:immunoglobulin-like and fibronectin type III domain-containing protein 1 [Hemibagrus wyckioides]